MTCTLPYFHVDAFADKPFTGNQAAVMPLDEWLPDHTMQAIGAENNFAETAFTIPDARGEADYELRWFTPTMEIRLCGHATLASGHIVLTQTGADRVTFKTRKVGVLEVVRAGDGYEVALPAIPLTRGEFEEASGYLGGDVREIWRNPLGYDLFVYDDEEAIRALRPDFAGLKGLGDNLFVCTAPGAATDIVSRVFVPGGGIDEDPVTGGAHAMLTPFWAERLGRKEFTAYQASARGGYLNCRLDGNRVWLGGSCVTVVEGRFFLPDWRSADGI